NPGAWEDWSPISFWVRAVNLSEEELPIFARHLNFYMRFFDRESPTILIHEKDLGSRNVPTGARYPQGPFPTTIVGRVIDPYLLALWETATQVPDPFREFLHGYQILEYAAFYHTHEGVIHQVRRVLQSPDVFSRIDQVVHDILDAVAPDRQQDDAKL